MRRFRAIDTGDGMLGLEIFKDGVRRRGASSIRAAAGRLFFEPPQTPVAPPTFQQLLCFVALCRSLAWLIGEKPSMMPRTAIAQIAKMIGRELDTGAAPSEEALAA